MKTDIYKYIYIYIYINIYIYIFFLIISRSILLTVRNISDKSVQKIKTHVLGSINFFFPENRAICEIMWKPTVEPGRPHTKKGRMRIACWNTQACEHTPSDYVIFIAFPLQQWLQERASMLSFSTSPVLFFSIGSTRALGPAQTSIQCVYTLVNWATLPSI